jgi:hypothetical protein
MYIYAFGVIREHIKKMKICTKDVPAFAIKAITPHGAAFWEVPESETKVRNIFIWLVKLPTHLALVGPVRCSVFPVHSAYLGAPFQHCTQITIFGGRLP